MLCHHRLREKQKGKGRVGKILQYFPCYIEKFQRVFLYNIQTFLANPIPNCTILNCHLSTQQNTDKIMLDICHSPMSSRPKVKGGVYFVLNNINAGAIKRAIISKNTKRHIYKDELECNTKNPGKGKMKCRTTIKWWLLNFKYCFHYKAQNINETCWN